MCLTHIRYDTEVWQHYFHQCLDFSRMVGTHLNDSDVMLSRQLQKGFRHTYMVVEVALCIKHIILLLQHRGYQFFCGCLSVGACDANDRSTQMNTVIFRQLLQGGQHIFHQNKVFVIFLGIFLLVNHGICCSLFQCSFSISITIKSFTFQREKHRALRHITAVSRNGWMLQEQFI